MIRKKSVGLIALAASILCLGTGVSLAGEVNGKGEFIHGDADTPLPGKSNCAFSGRQDNYEADFFPHPPPDGDLIPIFGNPLVQNWGQVAKLLKALYPELFPHPGTACNPQKSAGPA
jgi:hypothetical protein